MTRRRARLVLRVACILQKRHKYPRAVSPLWDFIDSLNEFLASGKPMSKCPAEEWEAEVILDYAREHCPDFALWELVRKVKRNA